MRAKETRGAQRMRMTSILALLGCLTLVGLVGWRWLQGDADGRPAAVPAPLTEEAPPRSLAQGSEDPGRVVIDSTPRSPTADGSPAPSEREERRGVIVQGLVFLPDRTAAAGETVELHLGSTDVPLQVSGHARTGSDGAFRGVLDLPLDVQGPGGARLDVVVRSEMGFAVQRLRRTLDQLCAAPFELTLRLERVGTVRGQVVTAEGAPLSARISLFRAADYDSDGQALSPMGQPTRSDGRFVRALPEAGAYVLVVGAPERGAICSPFELAAAGEDVDLGRIALEGNGTLGGIVLAAHGAPVPGLELSASLLDPAQPVRDARAGAPRLPIGRCAGLTFARATTARDGAFEMQGLAEGEFTLRLSKQNVLGQPDQPLATGARHLVQLPSYPFEAQVRDERGAPVPRARIHVEREDDAGRTVRAALVLTDEAGLALVPATVPGPFLLRVSHGQGHPIAVTFEVPATGCVEIPRCEIEWRPLEGSGAISVRILTDVDAPVAAARVEVRRDGTSQPLEERALPGGSPVVFEGLAPGRYLVSLPYEAIHSERHFFAAGTGGQSVELRDGELAHVELRVRLAGRLRVRVQAHGAALLDHWTLHAEDSKGKWAPLFVQRQTDRTTTSVHIVPGEWWTAMDVLEAGPRQFQIRRNGEPFATEQLHIQPGAHTDWDLRVPE